MRVEDFQELFVTAIAFSFGIVILWFPEALPRQKRWSRRTEIPIGTGCLVIGASAIATAVF